MKIKSTSVCIISHYNIPWGGSQIQKAILPHKNEDFRKEHCIPFLMDTREAFFKLRIAGPE